MSLNIEAAQRLQQAHSDRNPGCSGDSDDRALARLPSPRPDQRRIIHFLPAPGLRLE